MTIWVVEGNNFTQMFPRRASPHVTGRRWNMALQQSWIPIFYCQVRQGGVIRFLFFSICCVFLSVHLTFLYMSLVQSRVLACSGCSCLFYIFFFYFFVFFFFLSLSPLGFSFLPCIKCEHIITLASGENLLMIEGSTAVGTSVGVESPRWIQTGVECMWPATDAGHINIIYYHIILVYISIIMIYHD